MNTSFRVAYENWYFPERFNALLDMLDEYPDTATQLALFSSMTHTALPLPVVFERAGVMERRIAQAKERGYSCGINLLVTIGHHNENLPNQLQGNYSRMTNISGEVCLGSFCMNDKSFVDEYVVPVYTALAKAKPDFIWVDDDVRVGHMPIGKGCYCDKCIARFNRENGTDYDRESLREALNSGDLSLREKWLRMTSGTISDLLGKIAQTVAAVDGGIVMGFMTGNRFAEGYDFVGWANALSLGGKNKIMWRPGGGSYTDYSLDELVSKSEDIGRQNAYLPEYVTDIQSEIENFPYQLLKKGPKSTALEAAMHIAAGCTGTAFNILVSESGEDIKESRGHIAAISEATPFYRILSETLGRSPAYGIHDGWSTRAKVAAQGGDWANDGCGDLCSYSHELFGFGLPAAYSENCACVFMLHGKNVLARSREELVGILSGGVYLDAGALECLNEMGLGELTGFRIDKEFPVDAIERYLPHTLNTGFEGKLRNCRQAFYKGGAVSFIPSPEAQALCELVDYTDSVIAPCSMGIFRNSLGGTVCVGGYYPFSWISDTFKALQLRRLFLTLSGGGLPSYVETYCRIKNTSRITSDGRLHTVLLNESLDTLRGTSVRMKTGGGSVRYFNMKGEGASLPPEGCDGGYYKYTVPVIGAWEMVLLSE